MKEIDFLPSWYRSDRRQQISYRTQYAALGGIFVVMLAWNFVTTASISRATAKLAQAKSNIAGVETTSQEFNKIKIEVTKLQEKATVLEQIDSKIDVANVLAEVGFLLDKNIVLSKLELTAERFADKKKSNPNSGSAIRVVGTNSGKKSLPLGDVRFKVVLSGVASDAGDVAALICKLEDSPYFRQVIPSFSRNTKLKRAGDIKTEDLQASEFKITCELANYSTN